MKLRQRLFYLIYRILLVSIDTKVFGNVIIPLPIRNNEIGQNQYCHWEGQKIANPENGEKLFLCHFYSESNSWLLFPFHCASSYIFDMGSQRCIRRNYLQKFYGNQIISKEMITEIPDLNFTPQNPILNQNGRVNFHSGQNTDSNIKLTSGEINCEESLKSLTQTINSLSLVISKLSEKVNMYSPIPNTQGSNNTISITFPNFSSIHSIVKNSDENEKYNSVAILNKTNSSVLNTKENKIQIEQISPSSTPNLHNSTFQIISTTSLPLITRPLVIDSKTTTTTPMPTTTTLKSVLVQNNINPGFITELMSSSSEEDTHDSLTPGLKPGNNLFDFLFKNIFKPRPPTPPQVQKNHFLLNTSRPYNYGNFKPIPLRPRPPLPPPSFFNPFGGNLQSIPILSSYTPPSTNPPFANYPSTNSPFPNLPFANSPSINFSIPNSKPKPNDENFVNVFSFLHNLDQNPMTIYSNDSDEDDDMEDDDGNDVIVTFHSTTAKPSTTGSSTLASSTITTNTAFPPISTLPIPSSSNTELSRNSTKIKIPTRRIVSLDSKEFKHESDGDGDDDDETEDAAQDPLRQNNRKPREGLMHLLK